MATGTFYFYTSYFKKLVDNDLDFATDTIKVALLKDTYTPDVDAHDNYDDISAEESSGTAYSAGGATLASKTTTTDASNNRVACDAADASWAASTIANARYAAIYKDSGTPSTSPLIGYIDFGSTLSTSGTTFSIQFHSNGIFTIGAA